jgi:hypothetical protein
MMKDQKNDHDTVSLPSPTMKKQRRNSNDDVMIVNTQTGRTVPSPNIKKDNNDLSEWLLCRHTTTKLSSSCYNYPSMDKEPQRSSDSASAMILYEHLGDPSNMVHDLVDDFQNWSLTRWSSKGRNRNIQNSTSLEVGNSSVDATSLAVGSTSSSGSSDKPQRRRQLLCKQAQRQVRRALLSNQSAVSDVQSSKNSTKSTTASIPGVL